MGETRSATETARPRQGYQLPTGSPVGTQLWSEAHPGRRLHAVGCAIDGGSYRHNVRYESLRGRYFHCHRCAQTPDGTIAQLIKNRER